MTRGVRQVRRAIKQRKKQQGQAFQKKQQHDIYPFIQEEEKHGFEPSVYDTIHSPNKQKKNMKPNIAIKAFICVALFIVTTFVLTNETTRLQPVKKWVSGQLQDDFPFAKAKSWYETAFGGTPLSIAPQGSVPKVEDDNYLLPVMGQVEETFQANGTGITITPTKKSVVTSLDEGIVIFAGNDKKTGKTITIQHADGSNTTYGHLSAVDVHGYQPVEANERIGTFTPSEANESVYFSIKKNKEYIDPSQVIPVDDLP